MEDFMNFKSGFANSIISKILNSMIRKAGFDAVIRVHGLSIEHKDGDKVHIRANIAIDVTEEDIRKITKNI